MGASTAITTQATTITAPAMPIRLRVNRQANPRNGASV